MSIREVIEQLEIQGMQFTPDVRVSYPKTLSQDVLQFARQHKSDILRYLVLKHQGLLIDLCRTNEDLQIGSIWCRRCFRYQQIPCLPSDKVFRSVC